MQRIYDMNYDRWVEVCGPDSYKANFIYVDIETEELGEIRYHLGHISGDIDELIGDPIKGLSGKSFDSANFEDIYSEEQLYELGSNLQEIFIMIRDQLKKDMPSAIRSIFESSCEVFNGLGSKYGQIHYDDSTKLLTIESDKAYQIQYGSYIAFGAFAEAFEKLTKTMITDRYGSDFNDQVILANSVGKPIAIFKGFEVFPPKIAEAIDECNYHQENLLNKLKIEAGTDDILMIDGHITMYGREYSIEQVKKRLAEGMDCKIVENINEAPGSVTARISNLNYKVSDIANAIRNEVPLGKDSMNQKRFAVKLKRICQKDENQEILQFVDISSIVKRIDTTKYFEELNEDLSDLQIDESKTLELIRSTVEKECSEHFGDWIDEPYLGFGGSDETTYYFSFSVDQIDEETARNLNTKLKFANLGISNYNDELIKTVYQKAYDEKPYKTIDAELFDILDFDAFFKFVCDNSEIDLNDDEYDQLYEFVKTQFSQVEPLTFTEDEFILKSQSTVKEEVSTSVTVVLDCKDANRHSTYYD